MTAGGNSHRWEQGRTFFIPPSPGLVIWANTWCRAAAAPTGISQTFPKYRLTSNANPKGGWHQLKRWVAPIGVLAILGGRSFGFPSGLVFWVNLRWCCCHQVSSKPLPGPEGRHNDSHRWGKGRTFFIPPSPGLVLWANTQCRAAAAPTGISQTVPKYRLTSNANPKGGWHQLKRWVAPIGVLAILGGRSFGFQDGEIGNECRLRRSDRGPRRLPRHPARTEKKEESES
jgi:hypothetical protein